MHAAEKLTRRMIVQSTLSGALALSLPRITAFADERINGVSKKVQRSMIVLFGEGGPASQDSFDPKCRSPQVESFFGEIPTTVPGVHFSEPWKNLAKLAHRMTLYRAHEAPQFAIHAMAVPDALQVNEGKSSHTFTTLADASGSPAVFMHTPNVVQESAGENLRDIFLYNRGLESHWQPSTLSFSSPIEGTADPRLQTRQDLLRTLEGPQESRIQGKDVDAWHAQTERAAMLLGQGKNAAGLLRQEDVDRYCGGKKPSAELLALLYARTLIEYKISNLIFIRTGGIGATKFQTYGWDHHYDAEDLLQQNIPVLDHTLAQLIRDTDPRHGSIPDTSVVFMSDMGRTPRIDPKQGGRDHFPWRTSMIVSPHVQPGVIGETDDGMIGRDGIISNRGFSNILTKIMQEDSTIE